jgi:hypothetical protein
MNGVEGESDGPMYEEDETSAIHDDHNLAKGPTCPFSARPPGIDDRTESPPDNDKRSMLSRLFGKKTVEQPVVKHPQFTYYQCRWPGCQFPVRNDEVGRWGGFCGTTEAR